MVKVFKYPTQQSQLNQRNKPVENTRQRKVNCCNEDRFQVCERRRLSETSKSIMIMKPGSGTNGRRNERERGYEAKKIPTERNELALRLDERDTTDLSIFIKYLQAEEG